MADLGPVPHDDADCAMRDVLLVIGVVLADQPGNMTAKMQEALATIAKLAQCRVEAALALLDNPIKVPPGAA